MEKIMKILIFITVISLIISQGITFLDAQGKNISITVYGNEIEVIDGEIYGCYESIAESVKFLDPPIDDEVFMDDTHWSFIMEVADNWWYSSCYFYRVDGPVKDNYGFIQPENIIKLKNTTEMTELRVKNFASSVALDEVEKRLAVTLRGPYDGNNGRAKFIFRAPKSGNIILYNDGILEGATPNSPFKSFGDRKASGYVELSIMRDEKVISNAVKISADNMKTEFPKIGDSGSISVEKDDELVIYVKSYNNINENNTVFIDPVVAYTEIFEQPEALNNTNDLSVSKDKKLPSDEMIFGIVGVIIVVLVISLSIIFAKKYKTKQI